MSETDPEGRQKWLAVAGVSSEEEARQKLAKMRSQANPSPARRRWRRVMRFIQNLAGNPYYEEHLAEKGDPDVFHDALAYYKRHPDKYRKLQEKYGLEPLQNSQEAEGRDAE